MTPKEMGDLHGILNKAFVESYWKKTNPDAFEKSRKIFVEKVKELGGEVRSQSDLPPIERYHLLSTGWAGDKINLTVGFYVRFPEETMRKILVLGLP